MPSLDKRTGLWRADISSGGKRHRKCGFKTKESALEYETTKKLVAQKKMISEIKKNNNIDTDTLEKIKAFQEDIPNTIKLARRKRSINQKELAKLLDIGVSTLSNWEKGKVKPSLEKVRKLIEVINVKEISTKEKLEEENEQLKKKLSQLQTAISKQTIPTLLNENDIFMGLKIKKCSTVVPTYNQSGKKGKKKYCRYYACGTAGSHKVKIYIGNNLEKGFVESKIKSYFHKNSLPIYHNKQTSFLDN